MADVGFDVLSPWTGAERGWKTHLAKNGSRLYKGNKKSIKLLVPKGPGGRFPGTRRESPNANLVEVHGTRCSREMYDRSPARTL